MKCQFCAGEIGKDTLVCSYCGQRNPIVVEKSMSSQNLSYQDFTSLEKVDETSLTCAECHTQTMKFIEVGDFREVFNVAECNICNGVFLSKEVLEKSIKYYGWRKKSVNRKIKKVDKKIPNSSKLYACPICDNIMKRYAYKISSGVIVDECAYHGFWLNKGELLELIEWQKGIKDSQNREAQEEAYKKYGLKRIKSKYTYQKYYATRFDRFFEWLLGA